MRERDICLSCLVVLACEFPVSYSVLKMQVVMEADESQFEELPPRPMEVKVKP